MNQSRGVTCSLVAIASLFLAGCITLPTIGTPKTMAVSASRVLAYDAETADKTPIAAQLVAQAIAEVFPPTSKYGEYRTSGSNPAFTSIGSRGFEQGPMTRSNATGVRANASGNVVTLEYARGIANSTGRGESITRGTLTVTPVAGKAGHFSVSTSPLSERVDLSPGLGVVGIAPVAPLDQIADDVAATVKAMKPSPKLQFGEQAEFVVQYPVPSVFANYERRLGRSTRPSTARGPDAREGRFTLSGETIAREVAVSVSPYRNASRVNIAFLVPYELKEGGGSTFSTEKVSALTARLRQIASE